MLIAAKKRKKDRPRIVNFKATDEQKAEMQKNADKFTEGNLSTWIIYTALNYKPKPSELEEEDFTA